MPSKSASKSNSAKGKSNPKQKKVSASKGKKQQTQKEVSSPAKEASKSSKSVQQASKPAQTEPVPVPVQAEQVEVKEQTTADLIEQEFSSIVSKINDLKTLQASISSDLKKLQKNIHRHIKENKRKKKRVSDPNKPKRNPSGFAKPAPLSSELCDFLEKPYGTEMARTDVTREITQYIKKQNLQDEKNRRIILPDKKLQVLMKFPEGDEPITYFNLQKYLAVHFLKKESSAPTKTI